MSSIARIKSTLTTFWGKYGRGTARTCRVVASTLVPGSALALEAIFGVLEDKAGDLREDELKRRIDQALAGREQEQQLIAEMLVLISENLTGLMDQVAAMASAPGITEDTLAQVIRGALASSPEVRATRDKLHELACKLGAIHGDVLANQEMIKRLLIEQGKQADLLQQLLNVAREGRAYASQIGEPNDFAARYQLDILYQRFDQAVLQADADSIAAIIAEVQELAPKSARLPVMRAVLALLRNQPDNMLAELQKALELDPTSSTLIGATQAAQDTVYAQPRDHARDTSRDSKRLTINDTVGDRRWKITAEIGRGGMGSVFRVEDRMGQVGALKVMQREILADKRAEALFESEVRSLLDVNHPSVVRVVAWGECSRTNHPYIVMELVEGQSLNLWLKAHGPMDESTACAFFAELADALAACHARNVLHRDIKPDNILVVERDGKPAPVLIDFGIAGETQSKGRGFDPNFAAPEVMRRNQTDVLSDVFSLGATMMYALASGPSSTVYHDDFDPESSGISDRLDELLARAVSRRRLRCGLADVIEGLRGSEAQAEGPERLSDAEFAEWQRKLEPHGVLEYDDEGRLDFEAKSEMSDSGLQALEGLTLLQSLDLRLCDKITDAGLRSLEGLTSLQSLGLRGCDKITDAGLRSLAGLTTLQSLDLYRCGQITDAGLRSLAGLTSLQSLDLSYCDEITDAGLRSLAGLTSLQTLYLS